MDYIIKNSFYTATISSLGAELTSMKSPDGYEYIWHNTKNYWNDHAPLLFPICGRLKDNTYTLGGKEYHLTIHGFIARCEFTLVSSTDTSVELSYSSNDQTRAVYPFDFTLTAKYELVGDELVFTTTVKNDTDTTMPYMFGWHPGFNLPCEDGQDINDYKVDFGLDKVIKFDIQHGAFVSRVGHEFELTEQSYKLCEEEIYANDTMIFGGHNNEIKMYADGHPYLLEMSWTENLPTLCVWKWPANDAKYVCIEPWSSKPKDGITDENFDIRPMARLGAGLSDVYRYTVKITK